MSLRFRDAGIRAESTPRPSDLPASPPVVRQRRTRWRDPRLWLGIALVLACVAIGSRILTSADDTVAMWQVTHDIPAGGAIRTSDLRVTQVHFDEPALAASYVAADTVIGSQARAVRDLHSGELLAADAMRTSSAPAVRQLPLGVGTADAPLDLRAGDHVQVWAVPTRFEGRAGPVARPRLALPEAVVLSVGSSALGAAGERQVLVALPPAADVASVLQQTAGSTVVLVRLAR